MSKYLLDSIGIIDSYPESNISSSLVAHADAQTSYGQTFTGNGQVVSHARFWISKTGSPSGTITASIFAHTGTYGTGGMGTGSALAVATKTVSGSSVTSTLQPYVFEFSNFTALNGTNYVIVVSVSGGDVNNYWNFAVDNTSPSHPGNAVSGSTGTTARTDDLIFYVHYAVGQSKYRFDGSGGWSDPDSKWSNEANIFDTSLTTGSGTTEGATGSLSANFLLGEGTNAPSSGGTIHSVKVRYYSSLSQGGAILGTVFTDGLAENLGTARSGGGSQWGLYTTLSTPTGGWTWPKLQTLEVKFYDDSSDFGTSVYATEILVYHDDGINDKYLLEDGSGYYLIDYPIELDTADATDFGTNNTPTLEFTGSDLQSNDLRYNVQIATAKPITKDTPIDSYSQTNQSGTSAIYSTSSNRKVGQTFSGNGKSIGGASFLLRKTGNPTANMYVEIYDHTGVYGSSGIPSGSPIATSDVVSSSTLTTTFGMTQFTFSGVNQINLSSSSKYIAAVYLDGGDAANNIVVGWDVTSPTHSGTTVTYGDDGGFSWFAVPAYDTCFSITDNESNVILNKTSGTDIGFINTVNGADTDPFTPEQKISYTVQPADALSSGTYYWRARVIDPSGSNVYSPWSGDHQLTVSSGTISSQTQTGISRIEKTVTSNQTGLSRIELAPAPPKDQTGVAHIVLPSTTETKTQTGVSRVELSVARTQTGVSRITQSVPNSQTGISRITKSVSNTQAGVARISQVVASTQTGTTRIQATATQNQTGKGSLVYTVIAGQAGSSTLPSSTTANNTGTGSVAWSNTANATASDGAFANTGTLNDNMTGGNVIYDSHVKLIKGGTVQTTNKADTSTTWPTTFSTFNYGGSTDLWGDTWTATDINASNFGVAFAAAGFRDPGYTYSNYLYVTGFGFNIPAGSTINGITASVIKRKQDPLSNGTWVANVDYISVTVYYGGEMTGKASIAVAVDTSRTITGVSRIAQTASYTQTGVSRITNTATRDQTGRADVLNTTSQNVTGASRITISSTKTQTGVSAIAKTTSLDQTGTSRVQVTTTRTQTGIADVIKAITQTITGLSRIAYTTTQLQTGAARITLIVPRTQTGISRITITTTRDQLGVARVTLTVPRTQTGTARITATNLASVTGVTRIQITSSGNQTGLSRIQHIILESQDGVARIALISSRDQSGTARVSLIPGQNQTGLARITNTSTQDITGTSDVQRTFTVGQNGVARITAVGTQTQTGKANVQNTTLQTQTGTSRLGGSITQDQTGLSRVALITQQPQTAISKITGITNRAQTGVARLGNQPLSNLYDDFNDNSFDTLKWEDGGGGGTLSETGGKLVFSIPANQSVSQGLLSINPYNLHSSLLQAEISVTGSATAGRITEFGVFHSAYTSYAIFQINLSAGGLSANYNGTTIGSSITYSPTDHKILRLRESSGTVYWDTSTDGITWTNRWSTARLHDFTSSLAYANASSSNTSLSAWTMSLDNVNITVYPRTQTGVSRITSTATRDQTGKGRVTQTATQTTTGTSRVTNVVPRTQTGVSRITNTVTRTQTGVASIVQLVSRDTTGLSRITKVIGQNQTGTGRLQNNVNQTQMGTGDVLRTVEQDISGTTLLAGLSLRDIDGRASVSNNVLQTQRGQALVVRPYGTFDEATGVYPQVLPGDLGSITAIEQAEGNVYDVSYNENGNFTPTQEDDTGSWETP